MLSDQEKERLRAEEIFRHEVRESLNAAPQQTRWQKVRQGLWAALNSAIVLWVLSTGALGAFTARYTAVQNTLKEARERRERIDNLDMEMEGRLSGFLVNCKRMVHTPPDRQYTLLPPFGTAHLQQQWQTFKLPPNRSRFVVATLPQYADRSTISLVMELSKLLEAELEAMREEDRYDPHEGEDLVAEMLMLQSVALSIQDDRVLSATPPRTFLPVWKNLRSDVLASRWTGRFPYTDCKATPFCDPQRKLDPLVTPSDLQ